MVTHHITPLGPNELTHLPLDKNGRLSADNVIQYIFMNEKLCISIQISL